jgi:hypothetical protein
MNNKKSKEKNTFILQFTYIPSLDLFEYICMEVISYLKDGCNNSHDDINVLVCK